MTPRLPLPEPVLRYLDRTNLQAPRALVLPLTGDASDRRYFRVLPRGGGSFMSLRAAPGTARAVILLRAAFG